MAPEHLGLGPVMAGFMGEGQALPHLPVVAIPLQDLLAEALHLRPSAALLGHLQCLQQRRQPLLLLLPQGIRRTGGTATR